MLIRMLRATLLGIIILPCLSSAQESALTEPRSGGAVARSRSSNDEMVIRIFPLKYYAVDDLADLIENIFVIDDGRIHADHRSKQLIIHAKQSQIGDVEALISRLDVPDSQSESGQVLENFDYRVFMLEIPSTDEDMKRFSAIIQIPSDQSSATVLENAVGGDVQINNFHIIEEESDEVLVLIQGRAPSQASINKIAAGIANCQIRELEWDDEETFTHRVETAHPSRLPENLLNHIQKLLGEQLVTVGYWFGTSSAPGEVVAPIGPWRLKLELELHQESDRSLGLMIEVEEFREKSGHDRQLGRERDRNILSNRIMTKVGKPIIVGYNRLSYGSQKMGALVIIPETGSREKD